LNAVRTNRPLCVAAVVATLIAWFVLSNHCALGGMGSRSSVQQVHGCCHNGGGPPVKEPTDGGKGTECCKSIHATVSAGAKLADIPPPLCAADPFITSMFAGGLRIQEVEAAFGDTGPPAALSFSELVLHRSLRSLAPPFSA